MAEVVAIGECMVEVGLIGPGQAALGYAGDTFNTAVYLRRLGRSVAYGTAVGGDDPFSAGILRLMADEGVDASLVRQVEGRLPGVYAIDRDPAGERRFFYWRAESPARDYFALADRDALHRAVTEAKLVYVSGVTLAIIGEAGRQVLLELLAAAKAAGAAVALDPNHRPQLWRSPDEARAAIEAVIPYCRYVSTGASDLAGLFGEAGSAKAQAWAADGVEVVIRADDYAVTVRLGGETLKLPPDPPVRALDTTGAGDAFNAGYLWARLAGREPRAAVRTARRLANFVVQHIGAIIPRAAMQAAQAS
ncbi:MAG: kdgK [Phenylobacterium sp.]|nr:kdgK [Phenylobacterium sp.]